MFSSEMKSSDFYKKLKYLKRQFQNQLAIEIIYSMKKILK